MNQCSAVRREDRAAGYNRPDGRIPGSHRCVLEAGHEGLHDPGAWKHRSKWHDPTCGVWFAQRQGLARSLQPQETQVYFLQRPSDQHVKIGYTRNVSGRVKESGRDNGGVILLATEPGGRAREAELHRQFAECRVASNHEWFFPVARLMDYIASLQAQ